MFREMRAYREGKFAPLVLAHSVRPFADDHIEGRNDVLFAKDS
jgi:hypothetical protein